MIQPRCDYCRKNVASGQAVCDSCGMPIRLRTARRLFGVVPLTFPVFVSLLAVLSLVLMLWLPR